MKKYSLLAAVALLTVGSFASCSKDKDPTPITKSEQLAARNWRITAFTVKQGNNPIVDEFARTAPCDKDDFYQFKADKTFVLDEGATRCSPNSPQTNVSGWDINADGTILLLLEMKGATSAELYEIKELTNDKLRIGQTFTEDGESLIADITFTAF
ncbi:lipocalin family protein [Hymenobacter lapidiphilus]|uniref:Lipocalin family protein n=1 Tax=Hymenobacter lapidiphilus TaxID=2608003 RepID=A0A7Y7PN61_9BACT|nr:lipocalin family protein [Hymenobacter lapidiphilus]NVO30888.1 lipocalin family protein [Hymenobacter lapidiphilus]